MGEASGRSGRRQWGRLRSPAYSSRPGLGMVPVSQSRNSVDETFDPGLRKILRPGIHQTPWFDLFDEEMPWNRFLIFELLLSDVTNRPFDALILLGRDLWSATFKRDLVSRLLPISFLTPSFWWKIATFFFLSTNSFLIVELLLSDAINWRFFLIRWYTPVNETFDPSLWKIFLPDFTNSHLKKFDSFYDQIDC